MNERRYDAYRDYRDYVVDPLLDGPLLPTSEASRRLGLSGTSVIGIADKGGLPCLRGPQPQRPRYLFPRWAVDGLAEIRRAVGMSAQDADPADTPWLIDMRSVVAGALREVLADAVRPGPRAEQAEVPDVYAAAQSAQLATVVREADLRRRVGTLRREANALMREVQEKLEKAFELELEADALRRAAEMHALMPVTAAELDDP